MLKIFSEYCLYVTPYCPRKKMVETAYNIVQPLYCVTIVPYLGTLVYNAQSPDEAALVSAARNFGYVFVVS